MSLNLKGKGRMAKEDEEEPVHTDPDLDFSTGLYEDEDQWQTLPPTSNLLTDTNRGESSAVGGTQEQPNEPEQTAERQASSSPLSALASRTPTPPALFDTVTYGRRPWEKFTGDLGGMKPPANLFVESHWNPYAESEEPEKVIGVAAQLMAGHSGYIPAVYVQDPRMKQDGEHQLVGPETQRKFAPLRGTKRQKKRGTTTSLPTEPIFSVTTLPPAQLNQQVVHEAPALPVQLGEAEARAKMAGMESNVAADEGKRLLQSVMAERDQNRDFVVQAQSRITELEGNWARAEGTLAAMDFEIDRAEAELAKMKERAEAAEDLSRRMFQEGTDKVAQFNKEFAELSIGLRNADADQARIRELRAALEAAAKDDSADQRLRAVEETHAAILRQLEGQLGEQAALIDEMSVREQKVTDEHKAQVDSLAAELEQQHEVAGGVEARTRQLEKDKIDGERTIAAAQRRVAALTEQVEREKTEHDRAAARFEDALEQAAYEQKVLVAENSQLRDNAKQHALAVATVQRDLVASKGEAERWKEAANSKSSTELRSPTSDGDKAVPRVSDLESANLQLTIDKDAAVADKIRAEKTVSELQEQAKTTDKENKEREELRTCLVRSQTLVADLQAQLEYQQKDPRLQKPVSPPAAAPANTKAAGPGSADSLGDELSGDSGSGSYTSEKALHDAHELAATTEAAKVRPLVKGLDQQHLPYVKPRKLPQGAKSAPSSSARVGRPRTSSGLPKSVTILDHPAKANGILLARAHRSRALPRVDEETAEAPRALSAPSQIPEQVSKAPSSTFGPIEDDDPYDDKFAGEHDPAGYHKYTPGQDRAASEKWVPRVYTTSRSHSDDMKRASAMTTATVWAHMAKIDKPEDLPPRLSDPRFRPPPLSDPPFRPRLAKTPFDPRPTSSRTYLDSFDNGSFPSPKAKGKDVASTTSDPVAAAPSSAPKAEDTTAEGPPSEVEVRHPSMTMAGAYPVSPKLEQREISSTALKVKDDDSPKVKVIVKVKEIRKIVYVLSERHNPFRCWAQVYIDLWTLLGLWLTIQFSKNPVTGTDTLSPPSVAGLQASSVVSSSVAGPQASSVVSSSVVGPQASSVVMSSVEGLPPASSVVLSSVVGPQASSVVSPSVAGHQASSVVLSSVAGHQASSVDPSSSESHVTVASPESSSVVGHQASSVDPSNLESDVEISSREAFNQYRASCPTLRVTFFWLLIHFALYAFIILCGYNYWLICKQRATWSSANDATRQIYQEYYGRDVRWGLAHHYFGELRTLNGLWFLFHMFLDTTRAYPG